MPMGAHNQHCQDRPLDERNGGPGAWLPAAGIGAASLDDHGALSFSAIATTRMPMLVTDPNLPDDPVVFVNQAFLDLTGYPEQQVLGRNCRFLQGAGTDRHTVDDIGQALRERRAVAVEILNYKADGEAFWNALFIGPVFDQHGKLLYFVSSQMDITDRRLSQDAALQAEKMEAIGQLTAGVAHDFNNLLQVINGNLDLTLRLLSQQTAAAEPVKRAQRAAMRAGKLTQQLLTFACKQRLEPRRVNLNALLVELSDRLMPALGDRVHLRLDLKPGLPCCALDKAHFETALLGVLANARDALPDGGEVTLATAVTDLDGPCPAADQPAAGGCVALTVQDSGSGMPPEVLRRATEPFFSTKCPGSGLGLAMVHGFVQQSHGHLRIDSSPGEGTLVCMTFPAAGPAPEAGTQDHAARAAPARQCILLVEDNDDVRQLAASMLELAGYKVLAAPSGERALDLLAQQSDVDLLFSDVIMPGGMNGLQLVDKVRAQHPGLPVLLTSGYMDDMPGKAGEPLDVLPKPYHHEALLARVRQALQR
jgi:PAS domain S-box-containing protein